MAMRGRRSGGLLSDFIEFLKQGNVVDLAVAIIIGGAFGKIINSFVEDILTPAILSPALRAAGVDNLQSLSAGGIKYGLFIAAVLNFIVIALCLFLLIRSVTAAKRRLLREEIEAEAEAPADPALVATTNLTEAVNRLTSVMQSRS